MQIERTPGPPQDEDPDSAPSSPVRSLTESAFSQRKIAAWLLALSLLYTLYFARDLLVPIVLSLYFTALLQPPVYFLKRLGIPAVLGAFFTILMSIAVVGAAFFQLSYPASEWLDKAPRLIREAEFKLYGLKLKIEEAQQTTKRLQEMTELDSKNENEKVVVEGPGLARRVFGHTRDFGVTAIIVLVLIFFFLSKGSALMEQIATVLGDPKGYVHLVREIRREAARYLLTISLINFGLAVATAALMSLLGMPNPVLWGVIAGIMNFIPYLGGVVTTGIVFVVSLLTFESGYKVVLPPLLFIFLNGMEGHVITPMLLGRRFTVNPVIIFIFILFWGWMWGVIGIFLAMPILVSLKISVSKIKSWEFLSVLSDD
ncbi:MAG: AI-2E family transporter [Desulfobacteraceae bacterium]|nr:MAG: AI-2E family transporter [Desulfobacteraceae bacterium]